ncbi:hypothetical protein LZ30DRAFT_790572, partial [Colletotrichum cereale]
ENKNTHQHTLVASWEDALRNGEPDHVARRNPEASQAGSFFHVNWQPRKWRLNAIVYHPDCYAPLETQRLRFSREGFEMIGPSLMEMTNAAERSYHHFITDCVLNRQLELARRSPFCGGAIEANLAYTLQIEEKKQYIKTYHYYMRAGAEKPITKFSAPSAIMLR